MKKTIFRAGLAAGLATAAGGAWATPCESVVSSYEGYYLLNQYANAAYVVSNHPECFGGSPASSGISINSTSFLLFFAVTNALFMRQVADGPAPVNSTGLKGMAAGNGAGKWNVWGNLTNTDTRQDYTAANGFKTKNYADVTTIVAGADYGLSQSTVLGVSGAFDDGDGHGRNLSVAGGNSIATKGYVIAPYLGMQLSRNLSFDASAGLGRGEMHTSANTSANASRWFAAANLTYNRWFDRLQFTGKASLLHGGEDYGKIKSAGVSTVGTDAKNTLDQLKLSAQVGYWMNGVMPVASLSYANDLRRRTTQFGSPNNPIGRDGWVLGAGLNFYSVKDGITGGVMFNQEVGRGHQNQYGLMANINLRF